MLERARLTTALHELLAVETGSTLLINALPDGVALDLPGALCLATGGAPRAGVEILAQLGPSFDPIIIVGEPSSVLAMLELAHTCDLDLARLPLRAITGGSFLLESTRTRLAALLGIDLDDPKQALRAPLSSFGMSEVGMHLMWETPATVMVRRVLERSGLRRVGSPYPCLMTYDPEHLHVEIIDGELVLSKLDPDALQPIIRYNSHDPCEPVDLEAVAAAAGARRSRRRPAAPAAADLDGHARRRSGLAPTGGAVMTVVIRTARDEADLAAVRRLRNQVFVNELGLAYDALDDRIDEYSTILIGERDGEVLASMRLTRRSDGPLEDEGPLDLALWTRTLGDHELFQASRFVITSAARAGSAQLQMITAAYRRVQAEGGRLCFIDCDPALARYYLRLGFRRFSPSYPHPILRHPYLPLVSFIGDLDYFRRTRALLGAGDRPR